MSNRLVDRTGWRVKRLRVGARLLMTLLGRTKRQTPTVFEVADLDGLPEDYQVVGMNRNWGGMCVEFLISHPSFDEVPEGAEPPEFDGGTPICWKCVYPATKEELDARYEKDAEWFLKSEFSTEGRRR